eukprot:scaffold10025_cov119-Isochrysis_galbana.AAC.9
MCDYKRSSAAFTLSTHSLGRKAGGGSGVKQTEFSDVLAALMVRGGSHLRSSRSHVSKHLEHQVGTRSTRSANALNRAGSVTPHSRPRAWGSRRMRVSSLWRSSSRASSPVTPAGSASSPCSPDCCARSASCSERETRRSSTGRVPREMSSSTSTASA